MKQTSNETSDRKDEKISTQTTTTTTTVTPKASETEKKQSKQCETQQPTASIPFAKALYDFQMNPMDDEGCLKFQKGAVLQVTRRVDQNWAEGKLNDDVGIFPLSFVNMNQAATALMQSYATKWRLPASMPSNSDQSPSTSTSPQRQVQQQPPVLQPTPAHPMLIRPTSPPSNTQNAAPAIPQISQDKTGLYIALHNYMPLKADELELKKGSQYIVKEACQDGWLKGCCSDNPFKKGVFPGNYVMPMLYHQKMMAMQRNAALQAQKNQSNSNTQQMRTTGAYTNLGLSSIPPELPQRNIMASSRTTQSPLQNKVDTSIDYSPTQKTDDIASKQRKETMTEMLMKKLGYNRKSNDSCAYSMDNPVFEDALTKPPSSTKSQSMQYNHMRSGSCPVELGVGNVSIENLQFGSQRVKTRERTALPM